MNEMPRRTKFYLDKQNAKWMGVCSGIADYTGVDVTVIRIGMVVGTILGSGALILVYIAAGLIAPPKRASPRRTIRDVRSKFRDLDRRLADVEIYVTSSNTSLSREIESLR